MNSKRSIEATSLTSATFQEILRELLVRLGEDPEREGLARTPERMERALKYLTKGHQEDPEQATPLWRTRPGLF